MALQEKEYACSPAGSQAAVELIAVHGHGAQGSRGEDSLGEKRRGINLLCYNRIDPTPPNRFLPKCETVVA